MTTADGAQTARTVFRSLNQPLHFISFHFTSTSTQHPTPHTKLFPKFYIPSRSRRASEQVIRNGPGSFPFEPELEGSTFQAWISCNLTDVDLWWDIACILLHGRFLGFRAGRSPFCIQGIGKDGQGGMVLCGVAHIVL